MKVRALRRSSLPGYATRLEALADPRLLRLQVKDFIAWLKREGVI